MDPITVIATPIVDLGEDIFADIDSFLSFGGGPHLSPYQQRLLKAGLLNARSLQGFPTASQVADSAFTYALNASNAFQGPKITGASAAGFGIDPNPEAGLEQVQTTATYMTPVGGGGSAIDSNISGGSGGAGSTGAGSTIETSSSAGIVWPATMAGRAFQTSFNGTFNVVANRLKLFTSIGNTTPDVYRGGVGLLELKNGAYIYKTPQIARQLAFALEAKVPLFLGVSSTGTIAQKTLAEIAETGGQAFAYDAEAGTIAGYESEEVSRSLLQFLGLLAVEE